jgi:hypothetical protein
LLCSTKTPEKVWLFCNVSIESGLNQAAKKWLSAPLTPLHSGDDRQKGSTSDGYYRLTEDWPEVEAA